MKRTLLIGVGIAAVFWWPLRAQAAEPGSLREELRAAPFRIAFETYLNDNWEILVMNADGTGEVNITDRPSSDKSPCWSPDGSKIAFHSRKQGEEEVYLNDDIFVMNADGSNRVNITNNPADDAHPAWSPGGAKIAFASERSGSWQVYTMDADGSDVANLSNNAPVLNTFPRWSPDGKMIAFDSTRDGNWDVYIMFADGKYSYRITNDLALDWAPSWILPSEQPPTVEPAV